MPDQNLKTSVVFPAGGYVRAVVNSVALADNGAPPHAQQFDHTWEIPLEPHKYGNPDGAIVTQGYPNNGGSHSWEYLFSDCSLIDQGQNPPIRELKLTAISDLDSGVGHGTGASSDFDTEWSVFTNLPTGKWRLSVAGIVNADGATPVVSIRINNDPARSVGPGAFIQTFDRQEGIVAVVVSLSQGHKAIFPQGPAHTTANYRIESKVAVSFSRL